MPHSTPGGGGLTGLANSPYLVPQISSKIKRPLSRKET
nr:MAG TPA: hypothetical protein [Bacteriophage sp.]